MVGTPVILLPPHHKKWVPNEVLKPVLDRATDLICDGDGKARRFQVVMGMAWKKHMESVLYEMAHGYDRMTLAQRLLICRCFTSVIYDDDLEPFEVRLVEDRGM